MSLIMAAALSVAPYDYTKEQCMASLEDLSTVGRYHVETGVIYGKKKRIVLQEIPFKNKRGKNHLIRAGSAYRGFTKLIKEARNQGYEFGVNSSFRTYSEQRKLWRRMPGVAANPLRTGTRSHQTGHSVDFSGAYVNIPFEKVNEEYLSNKWCHTKSAGVYCPTRFYWWLRKNAEKYGFENNVSGEPWHYTFTMDK
jgi:LAS superfamily LD-carboxypeptidase LdcB